MVKQSGEFAIITNYFKDLTGQQGVALGIGDDAALVNATEQHQLVMATDTLVEAVHFPADANAEQIAGRALCVNLSDMAAMGALPKWFTLALTVPVEQATDRWLQSFSRGLAQVAEQHNMALIGGDTTAGPLTISLSLLGEVPSGKALCRSGAKSGHSIYVTGTLGDGAAALDGLVREASCFSHSRRLLDHFYRPQAHIDTGIKLRDVASACIDLSDGLVADLGHICKASQVSAHLDSDQLPIHAQLKQLRAEQYLKWALYGGDDYQLCFTVAESNKPLLNHWINSGRINATMIGQIMPAVGGCTVVRVDGQQISEQRGGYDHFGQ